MTEADFIPRPGATDEEDGLLVSILFNATADTSSLAVFDPRGNMTLLGQCVVHNAIDSARAELFFCAGAVCERRP